MTRALLGGALCAALLSALLPPSTPDGSPARVTCTVFLPDAGRYARLAGPGGLLPDGGVVLPDWGDALVVREDLCSAAAGDGGQVAEVSPECACSSGATCTVSVRFFDGDSGTLTAPVGATLAQGTFSGAGCVLKVCGVLAGEQEVWPPACPLAGP